MQITEQQHKAAQEMFELIATELGKSRAVHAATAIASCARLSGSFMFRSFNLELKNVSPGGVVLSEEANEKWPVLVNILGWMLSNLGTNIDKRKLDEFPKTESKLNFLETLKLLQSKAVAIMNHNQLDFEQMSYACAIATSFLINECQQDLKVESGFNTAVFSFIEGSKTYPPELSNPTSKKKNIFGFWK